MQAKTRRFQNFLQNRTLNPGALFQKTPQGFLSAQDEQGFLVDQKLLEAYRMGRVQSGAFGCGWVACYNALRLLGKTKSAAVVIRRLEPWFVLGGKRGTHAAFVAPFFGGEGCRVRLSVGVKAAAKTASFAPANILYYLRNPPKGGHFVAFCPTGRQKNGQPVFRFYNAQSAPNLPCRAPAGKNGRFLCAGGQTGDERTLNELLAQEKPVLVLVYSLWP